MSAVEGLKSTEKLLIDEMDRACLRVDNLRAEYDAMLERLAAAMAARDELRDELITVQRAIRLFEPKGATA